MTDRQPTVEDIASDLLAYLGYGGVDDFLEVLSEACLMDNPNTELVRLYETVRLFYKAEHDG